MNALIEVVQDSLDGCHAASIRGVRNDWRHDVSTGAPDIRRNAADPGRPGPRALAAPIANRVVKAMPGNFLRPADRVGNLRILHSGVEVLVIPAAPIHFDVIEAP